VSRNYRIVLVVIVAAAAVGGYWKLALAPKRERAAALDQQVAAAQAQLAQTQALIGTYKDAKAQYKSNYATVVRLGKAVPTDDDTRSLVVQLDAAAKRSGIDFDNVDISASGAQAPAATAASGPVTPGAVNLGSFSAMPFNFSFTGRFENLSEFISRLERFVGVDGDHITVNGRLLRVDGLALHPAETGWPGLQIDVAASSYLVPAEQSLTGGGTAEAPASTSTSTAASGTATAPTTTSSAGSDLR
jgi:Tfp pilus assembly protein PilO